MSDPSCFTYAPYKKSDRGLRMPKKVAFEFYVKMWEQGQRSELINKLNKLPRDRLMIFGAYFLDQRNMKEFFELSKLLKE